MYTVPRQTSRRKIWSLIFLATTIYTIFQTSLPQHTVSLLIKEWRVVDTPFSQHAPNPRRDLFSALYQNHPKRCNVGDTLRALIYDEEGNEVNPEDVDAEIQWSADGVEITDATDAEYTVLVGDEGVVLSVEVTIGDETYTAKTEEVEPAEEPVEELTVSIDNTTPKVGDILTAEVVDRNGEDVSDNVTFQWYADDKAIEGADEETLVVDADLLGAALKVVVTAENGNTFASEPTAEVEAAEEALYTVLIDDTTPVVGQTLTAIILDSEDEEVEDTSDFAYQWYADGEKIRGEKEAELYVDDGLLGSVLSVIVYDADDNEYASEETAEVTDEEVDELTVSLDNYSPKVSDTLTAEVEPEDAEVEYAWYLLDSADEATSDATELDEDSDSLEVTASMVDKFIQVVVTDAEGNVSTATTTSPVGEDKSEDVSIIDRMGVQSDGTGIVGDQLRVSYGSTFGTPTAITWYRDGSVLTTWGNGNGNLNQDGALWLNINAARGTGVYKATVVAEGTTYTTNELTITNKEEAATIIDFTIEDDYTDGTDITYNTDDDTAVATVTLSKNYAGTFGFYKSNDSKFSGRINRFATTTVNSERAVAEYINADAGGDGTNRNIAQYTAVLTPDAPTNYNVLNINAGPNRAIGHINTDGTVTYKFNIAAGTLTRGSDYVVTFDQTSILTDTPGTGIANMFEEAVTVPYVTAPASIAVTKVSASNKPEVTFQDADGNALGWMQAQKGGAALTATGFTSAQIYSAKSKTNDPKGSDVSALTNANQNNSVEKGVWTSSVTAPADPAAYWFATATTRKGIFGEKEETLTSEPAPLAQKAATMMNLVESKTDAKTATVTFENLRADGTLYIVRGSRVWNATTAIGGAVDTDYYSDAERIYASYNAGVSEATTGKVDVEAGTKTVDVAGAIDEWKDEQLTKTVAAGNSQNWYGNKYIAVFVPNDEENYGLVYTNSPNFNASTDLDKTLSDDSSGMTLGQIATTLKYTKDDPTAVVAQNANILTITANTLEAYDQFGVKMSQPQGLTDATKVEVTNKDNTNTESASCKYEVIGNNGALTIKVNMAAVKNSGATKGIDAGDGFTIELLGSKLVIEAKSIDDITANTATMLSVKIDGKNVQAGPNAAVGSAVVNFPKMTSDKAAGDPIATVDDSSKFKTTGAAPTYKLQESADGMTGWGDTSTLALAGGNFTIDTANAIKAGTYYRIEIADAGAGATATPSYINMAGSSTDVAQLKSFAIHATSQAANGVTSGTQTATGQISGLDQYGDAIAISALTPAVAMTPGVQATAGAGTATLTYTADGKITISASQTGAAHIAVGDTFTYALATGQTLTAEVTTASSEAAASASTTAKFKLSVSPVV